VHVTSVTLCQHYVCRGSEHVPSFLPFLYPLALPAQLSCWSYEYAFRPKAIQNLARLSFRLFHSATQPSESSRNKWANKAVNKDGYGSPSKFADQRKFPPK